jgi:hypothetical protein
VTDREMNRLPAVDIASTDGNEMIAAIAKAERDNDLASVWQLLRPLLEQSPQLPRDHLLALVLFSLSMAAAEAHQTRARTVFLQTMREHCSRRAINRAVLSTLLSLGARQGWLSEEAYDDLTARIDELPAGHPARLHLVTIERRKITSPTPPALRRQ